MSRFYASIKGQAKTEATRRGGKKSGIEGHIRGWNVGISVAGIVGTEGEDVFDVWLTPGSNDSKTSKHIGRFTVADLVN